jgi:hypothetical protein
VQTPFTRVLAIVIAIALAAASFVYRFNALDGRLAGFENDHFPQLVRAMAMLDGERPLRDFMEAELRALWPAPTYSTSAVAQKVFGRSLRSEALLTIGMLSLGAGALFLVATQFAGAIAPALLATVLAVALRPALYNYPKIVLYVAAIAAMLGYARRPTTGRLVALGVVIGVAALFRHDHAVYLGLSAAALLVMLHGRTIAPRLAILAATSAAMILPGGVMAQIDGGLVTYLRECLALSRAEAARTTNARLQFSVDASQPLLHQVGRVEPQSRIAIRWVAALTPDARRQAEVDLQLANPVMRTDESNWSYSIADASATHLSAIVHDARVLDTDGIDRTRFTLTAPPPPPEGWTERLLRWRIAPGMLRKDNALPWLYVTAWAVVLCGVICAASASAGRLFTPSSVPLPAVRATCVLGLLMLAVLLRTPNLSRFADVSVAVTIIGAWLLAGMWRALKPARSSVRVTAGIALAIVLAVDVAAIAALAGVPHQVNVAGLVDPARGRQQWHDVWRRLGSLPAALDGIDTNLQRASAYLRRCTRPAERVFMGDNLPELFYFADRPFAAGQVRYFSNFYSSQEQQREAIRRWSGQQVPIAITQPASRFDQEFAADYPLLAGYLRDHYRRAGTLMVETGTAVDVWVNRTGTFVTDGESDLPCEAIAGSQGAALR